LRKRHGLSFGLIVQPASERSQIPAQTPSLAETVFPLDSGPDLGEFRDC
jgi:hypothetical protein